METAFICSSSSIKRIAHTTDWSSEDDASSAGESISCNPSDLEAPEAPVGVQKSRADSNSSCLAGEGKTPPCAAGVGGGRGIDVWDVKHGGGGAKFGA